jgi:pre-mRNA-splicing factor CWC22
MIKESSTNTKSDYSNRKRHRETSRRSRSRSNNAERKTRSKNDRDTRKRSKSKSKSGSKSKSKSNKFKENKSIKEQTVILNPENNFNTVDKYDNLTKQKEISETKPDISVTNNFPSSSLNLPSRAGGVYIPPFKMAQMIEEIRQSNDKQSTEYQRMMWDMLRKSINGIINKVNITNIHNIIYEILNENLFRGKGLLARAIIKAQMASPNFTHVYAAFVAVLNTKLPDIGELILKRYIIQFRKAYKRNNKIVCNATTKMLAQLINQEINNETLAYEILFLFLENPTEDSVEMACDFMIECGNLLSDKNPQLTHSIFERFRGILHEGEIDKRIQYTIESLFAIRKTNFKDHPAIIPELDLVTDEDKIIHNLSLDDELDAEDMLDIFRYEDNYEENENRWLEIKAEILGDGDKLARDGATEEANELAEEEAEPLENQENIGQIKDMSEADLLKLRRTIYLTIISTVDFQECCHKLLKLNMKEGHEIELVNMIIECCIQERTYLRFYGLLAERFCLIKEVYKQCFEIQFENQYNMVHRLETNKLRNLAKLFAHLLFTDAIDWSVFKIVKFTEEDTTSSSRIFIKIIFQELAEHMGLDSLNDRLNDSLQRENFLGLFCRDSPKNTRFSINFFTSIGLGALTENLREFLQNAERMIEDQKLKMIQPKVESSDESEDSQENSEDSDSDDGDSSSENESKSSKSDSSSSSSDSIESNKKPTKISKVNKIKKRKDSESSSSISQSKNKMKKR